jgi:hypothetical protein
VWRFKLKGFTEVGFFVGRSIGANGSLSLRIADAGLKAGPSVRGRVVTFN